MKTHANGIMNRSGYAVAATALMLLAIAATRVQGQGQGPPRARAAAWSRATQDIREALVSVIEFSAPAYTTWEGVGTLAVNVLRRGNLTSTVTVHYRTAPGTATAGLDYVAQRGTLTFGPLETKQTIYLETLGDGVFEEDETAKLVLWRPSQGAILGQTRKADLIIRNRKPTIVWVLHDEDPDYRNPPFGDTLQALDEEGHMLTGITGINISQTIGGWRAITAVDRGRAVLLCEFGRYGSLAKYDLMGNKLFSIDRNVYAADAGASATIYALSSAGTIDGESLLKISPDGSILAEAPFGGIDLVANEEHQGLFVVGVDIKYFDPDLNFHWSIDPIGYAAVSVDVSSDGSAWVAGRLHPSGSGSDCLLHVSNEGELLHAIPLLFSPACVRVDLKDDSVCVAGRAPGAVAKYDHEGRQVFTIPLETSEVASGAFSLAVDEAGIIWVGTMTDVRKYSPDGALQLITSRFATESHTWISIAR